MFIWLESVSVYITSTDYCYVTKEKKRTCRLKKHISLKKIKRMLKILKKKSALSVLDGSTCVFHTHFCQFILHWLY